MFNRYWEVRNNSARSAPTYGATINTTSTLFSEDFSGMTSGDSVGVNDPISNGSYDTTLDTSNHAVASITTNAGFGDGNVLQVTTGPSSPRKASDRFPIKMILVRSFKCGGSDYPCF